MKELHLKNLKNVLGFYVRRLWSAAAAAAAAPSYTYALVVAVACFSLSLAYSLSLLSHASPGTVSVATSNSGADATRPSTPLSGSAAATSSSALADGTTVSVVPHYVRSEWLGSWEDADGDGQDTRAEVLYQESLSDVSLSGDGRRVVAGRWVCPYTGVVFDSSSYLDIEHVVPLKEAHVSGGWAWSAEKKRRYANYMGSRAHLQAVSSTANRSKGDRRPDQWLPPYRLYRCSYVKDWYEIKRSWGLSMVASEKRFVDSVITACSR